MEEAFVFDPADFSHAIRNANGLPDTNVQAVDQFLHEHIHSRSYWTSIHFHRPYSICGRPLVGKHDFERKAACGSGTVVGPASRYSASRLRACMVSSHNRPSETPPLAGHGHRHGRREHHRLGHARRADAAVLKSAWCPEAPSSTLPCPGPRTSRVRTRRPHSEATDRPRALGSLRATMTPQRPSPPHAAPGGLTTNWSKQPCRQEP